MFVQTHSGFKPSRSVYQVRTISHVQFLLFNILYMFAENINRTKTGCKCAITGTDDCLLYDHVFMSLSLIPSPMEPKYIFCN